MCDGLISFVFVEFPLYFLYAILVGKICIDLLNSFYNYLVCVKENIPELNQLDVTVQCNQCAVI
jgi:hypothetical protein